MTKRILFILAVFAIVAWCREVPVRYWVVGDSAELEAIYVKTQHDTVYLRAPNAEELKHISSLDDAENDALQNTNGQEVEEDEDDDADVTPAKDSVIMTDEVKKSMEGGDEAQPAAAVDDGAGDDLETALQKEDVRLKHEEIAKIEEEIRQRDIRDSIEAANKNPFIKFFRLDLKRLYNLEDKVMIDLTLSNYVVPEPVVEEEPAMELYPPGKANLLVQSTPDVCSLFVNGIPLGQVTPDTIKNIRPGKYTISVMRVLKDVEWWGSTIVKINADSVNVVSIPVQRPSTRITLNTDPEAVEVFINKVPTENIMPQYMTDVVIEDVKPQASVDIYLRKVGYRDTMITTEIKAFMPNFINVEMQPVLDDLPFIEEQKAFNAERSQRRTGRYMLLGSIAPFLAGGILWYFAERDWSDAADKKKAYNLSAFESEDTKKMVKDNHDLNHSGDIKGIVAAGLGAVGLCLFTIGFVWSF
ncbi:hypothetical protein [Fibrobacter sp.]|uniref:hypothetical protein n=1 Tax=Fibrobacter sp. TaxID=35828 RepID=UPI001B05EAFC|nr:hypothetical protein [Fibrobacter sp.]MBO7061951.1 hypothetical protein [Fibrobacter sp.]MBO7106586.1 hypothetical protein [Fibrobacter sp.]MBR3668860.1 hypothetical protein [Fibrobacter sp.]